MFKNDLLICTKTFVMPIHSVFNVWKKALRFDYGLTETNFHLLFYTPPVSASSRFLRPLGKTRMYVAVGWLIGRFLVGGALVGGALVLVVWRVVVLFVVVGLMVPGVMVVRGFVVGCHLI